MSLTPGKWIAFQTPSQKKNVTEAPGEHWSVGIKHHDAMCHGVAENGSYMLFSGIGTKADAFAMAAAPALLEALEECAPELRIMSEWANGPTSAAYSEKYARALAAISLAKGEAK